MPNSTAATPCRRRRVGRRRSRAARPPRRLRLGFVSPDFCQHPVGFFLIRALENLDRGRWRSSAITIVRPKDRMTVAISSGRLAVARRARLEPRAAGGPDPRRQDRHPFRSRRPYGPQPHADLCPQAGPHPNHLDRLRRHDRAFGHRLSPGRSQHGARAGRSRTTAKRSCGCPTAISASIRRKTPRRFPRCRRCGPGT